MRLVQGRLGTTLQKVGFEEGKNLLVEKRFTSGKSEQLNELARDLVRRNVELIIAWGNYSIEAAMRATSTIPIVMLTAGAPVEAGFVKSLARPGGNVTGTTYNSPETAGKLLEILRDTVPGARRVAVLWNPNSPGIRLYEAQFARAARVLGIASQYFDVTQSEQVTEALEAIGRMRPDALYLVNDFVLGTRLAQIATFTLEHKLATVGTSPAWVDGGGLLYYGPDVLRIVERTASYVDRILRGAKPAELPIEQPTKYELMVNLKSAKALGLKIPQSILVRADRVIE